MSPDLDNSLRTNFSRVEEAGAEGLEFPLKRNPFVESVICGKSLYSISILSAALGRLYRVFLRSPSTPPRSLAGSGGTAPCPWCQGQFEFRPLLHALLSRFTHQDTVKMSADDCKPLCGINQFCCCSRLLEQHGQ